MAIVIVIVIVMIIITSDGSRPPLVGAMLVGRLGVGRRHIHGRPHPEPV